MRIRLRLSCVAATVLAAALPSPAWAAPGPIARWIATAFFVGAVGAAVVLLLRDALFDDAPDGDEARYDDRSAAGGNR